MAGIYPFKAILFNNKKIKDIAKVFCAPYDIISSEGQDKYYGASPYNMVRLVLNKGSLDESVGGNRYDNAAQEFKKWQENKVLIRDKTPAVYLYEQEFSFKSKKLKRLGIFARLKLSDGNPCIFPHEHTHSKPKIDRLKLITKVKANLSPIFCIFSDKNKVIARMAKQYSKKEPLFDFTDEEGIKQKIWRIDKKSEISKLSKYFKNKDIFIADGHHRFEVACQYRDLMNAGSKNKDAGHNFVMIYLTNADCAENLILPYHRVVVKKDVEKAKLLDYIKNYFRVEKAKSKDELFKFLSANKSKAGTFGIYFKGEIYKLKMRDSSVLKEDLFSDYSATVKKLDVIILQSLILNNLLLKEGDLVYTKDEDEACEMVDNKGAKCAIFLNPTPIAQLKEVVSAGLRMPQKSTYFYPKIPSGLVINKLD